MNIETTISKRLQQQFTPLHLTVENESYQHNVPAHSETHFKITIVSKAFDNQSRVARHQMIYKLLNDLMTKPIHALSIHAFTPEQWQSNTIVPETPHCLDGFENTALSQTANSRDNQNQKIITHDDAWK